jgi:hypothetical protein
VILKGGTGRRACHSGTVAPRLTASLPSVGSGPPHDQLSNANYKPPLLAKREPSPFANQEPSLLAKREPRFAISASLDRETIDKFFTFTWTASRLFFRAGRQATTKCP